MTTFHLMPDAWIGLTVTAALLQAVRTAGQKQLTAELSVWVGTYVRSLLGLPVMLAYLGVVKAASGAPWPMLNLRFMICALITALTQLAATAALLSLYRYRNFAVANQLGKTDMVFTAVLGSAVFGQHLSAPAWLALVITGAGVATVMTARTGLPADGVTWQSLLLEPSVRFGLFIGLMFGICNLALREAALALAPASGVMGGALTVTATTAIQVAVMAFWLSWREPGALRAIGATLPLAGFVGVTSALGSICWFTAFALEPAAHVRIVGQVEVVFTLLIAAFYFRERIARMEAVGIALTVGGIILMAGFG